MSLVTSFQVVIILLCLFLSSLYLPAFQNFEDPLRLHCLILIHFEPTPASLGYL